MSIRNKYFVGLGLWLCTMLSVSCGGPDTHKEHPDLDWLEGRWFAHDAGFHEKWEKDGDIELRGTGFTLDNGDTLFSETLRIFHSDTGTFYQALIQKQNEGKPVYFRLVHHEPDSFVFSNPKHDFLRYIIYKKVSDDNIHVFVRDGFGSDSKGFSMDLKKITH